MMVRRLRIGVIAMNLLAACACFAEASARQKLILPVALPPGAGQRVSDVQCAVQVASSVPTSALAFSSDSNHLYVGGYREVLDWDLSASRLMRRIGGGRLGGAVRSLALTGDGRVLVVGEGVAGRSGVVHLLDPGRGEVTASFTDPRDVVECLAISPDGGLLAGGSADGAVNVWDLGERKLVTTLKGGAGGVRFSPDGKLLATGGADRQLRMYAVEDWSEHSSVSVPDAITDVVFGPDGQFVAAAVSGAIEWTVRMQRVDNPRVKEARVLWSGGAAPLRIIAAQDASGRARRMYIACGDNTIKMIAGASSTTTAEFRGHADWVTALAVSRDGARLASGSLDGTVRLWTGLGRPLATLVQIDAGTDDWAVVTTPGFYTASSPKLLEWRGKGVHSSDAADALNRPEAVRRILSGQWPAADERRPAERRGELLRGVRGSQRRTAGEGRRP